MIWEIYCTECGEVIGTLEKAQVTQAELDLWKEQTMCSQSHAETIALEIQPG